MSQNESKPASMRVISVLGHGCIKPPVPRINSQDQIRILCPVKRQCWRLPDDPLQVHKKRHI
ncbi:hypothetical protein [Xenorhabdus taiwanensis]|uniref:hypothetical protein n=1 Tax=Xenorhabdus taiwanensis TaxID=3085177 RepID=UPI0035A66BC5